MADKSVEERLRALEVQLAGNTLQEHFRDQAELIHQRLDESFREQAELIERLFIYRFDELDKNWDAKLESRVEAKLETKLEAKLKPIRHDLAAVKNSVNVVLTRLR